MAAEEELLHRVELGVTAFTVDRHEAVMRSTHAWGKDTAATDKALRNCVLGTALSVIENMRIKRRDEVEALTAVSTAGFSGYALGRELLGTETARPSYSASESEERDNAVRIHDRSQAWPVNALMRVFKTSEPLIDVIESQIKPRALIDIVGARKCKATLLDLVVRNVAFAMAEEDLFGPFTPDGSVTLP